MTIRNGQPIGTPALHGAGLRSHGQAPLPSNRRGYLYDRGLAAYDSFTSISLLGRLEPAIERHLARANRPIHILEWGAGHGHAARTLKDRYGDRVVIDNVTNQHDTHPKNTTAFRHIVHADAAALTTLPQPAYDIILSIYGGSYHIDDPMHVMETSARHLGLGGEVFLMVAPDRLGRLTKPVIPAHSEEDRLDSDSAPADFMRRALGVAISRALGMELAMNRELTSATAYGSLYMRRTRADVELSDILLRGSLLFLEDASAENTDPRQALDLSNTPFPLTRNARLGIEHLDWCQRYADILNQRHGLSITVGFYEVAGGPLRTDLAQLPATAHAIGQSLFADAGYTRDAMPQNVLQYYLNQMLTTLTMKTFPLHGTLRSMDITSGIF